MREGNCSFATGSRGPAAEHENSFFDGIDVSLNGIAELYPGDAKFLKDGLAHLTEIAADALKAYAPDRPWAIAPALASGLKVTRDLADQVKAHGGANAGDVPYELGVKQDQFEKALAASLEVSFETTVAAPRAAAARQLVPP